MAQDLSDKNFEMWECLRHSRKNPIAIKYYPAMDAVFMDEQIFELLPKMYYGSASNKFFNRPDVLNTGWRSGVKPKRVH